MLKCLSAMALVASGLSLLPAHAADYKLEFSATDFYSNADDYHAPPQAVVTGSFTFSAATMYSNWTALKAIDLSIAGHRYSLSEVFFVSNEPGFANGGGTLTGGALREGTNDFDFSYFYIPSGSYSGPYIGLSYTVEGQPLVFSNSPSRVTITELAPVPEPEEYAMLLLGLAGIGCAAARRRRY